jgi:hypothetical protein
MNRVYEFSNFGQDSRTRAQLRRAEYAMDENHSYFNDPYGRQLSSGRWSSFHPVAVPEYQVYVSRASSTRPYKVFASDPMVQQQMRDCVDSTSRPRDCANVVMGKN